MSHRAQSLDRPNGESLHYQSWRPEGALRGLMLVIHGAAEHGGRYAEFATHLTANGFAVATVDLPGHGKSTGPRCCTAGFDDYLDAVEQAHRCAESEFSVISAPRTAGNLALARLPVFLVGHSMGGLVAVLYLQRHQRKFAGAVFSGAALDADPKPGVIQTFLVRALSKLSPSLGVLQLDAGAVSRDPQVVARYQDDPLVYSGKLTASLLVAMVDAMKRAREAMPRLSLPMLVMHGEDDRLVPPDASRLLIARAGAQDKTLRLYPGLYHEIFNEPERLQVIADLLAWVEKRLPAKD